MLMSKWIHSETTLNAVITPSCCPLNATSINTTTGQCICNAAANYVEAVKDVSGLFSCILNTNCGSTLVTNKTATLSASECICNNGFVMKSTNTSNSNSCVCESS